MKERSQKAIFLFLGAGFGATGFVEPPSFLMLGLGHKGAKVMKAKIKHSAAGPELLCTFSCGH